MRNRDYKTKILLLTAICLCYVIMIVYYFLKW